MELTIDINGEKQVIQVLESMRGRIENMLPAMKQIGSLVKNEALGNFKAQSAPDGTPWKPLSMATRIARAMRLSGGKGIKNKNGSTKKASQRVISSAQALLDTGILRASIQVQSADKSSVTISSRLKYSAIHQFGGKAGRGGRVTIPQRQYIGVNESMKIDILDIIKNHIGAAQ